MQYIHALHIRVKKYFALNLLYNDIIIMVILRDLRE